MDKICQYDSGYHGDTFCMLRYSAWATVGSDCTTDVTVCTAAETCHTTACTCAKGYDDADSDYQCAAWAGYYKDSIGISTCVQAPIGKFTVLSIIHQQ